MDTNYSQRFDFASIELFKNYCNIEKDKKLYRGVLSDKFFLFPKSNKTFFYDPNEPPYSSGFYNSDNRTPFSLYTADIFYTLKKDFYGKIQTIKPNQIKRHFHNPFSGIELYLVERSIKRENEKIKIKLFFKRKTRKVNCIYFSSYIKSTTIIFDLSKGNFKIVDYEKTGKKVKKHFYTNSFDSLHTAITNMLENPCSVDKNIKESYTQQINDLAFTYNLLNVFGFSITKLMKNSKYNNSPNIEYNNKTKRESFVDYFISLWMNNFIQIKKIKMPNYEGLKLIEKYYPTEKYLKKNDRKLVASILDYFGIKSKITIKILHEYPSLDFSKLYFLCKMLGKDFSKYLGDLNPSFYNNYFRHKSTRGENKKTIISHNINYETSKEERKKIIQILNENEVNIRDSNIYSDMLYLFYDHFKMLTVLKEFYPNLKLNASTVDNFRIEHAEYSKLERAIQRGYIIQHVFDEYLVSEIEEPIEVFYKDGFNETTKNVFFPKILKTTDDYCEEGEYMHHCVSGYIESSISFIISLRSNKDRVTCEFSNRTKGSLQERYFCNEKPPIYYEKALQILRDRVGQCRLSLIPVETKKIMRLPKNFDHMPF